MAMRDFFDKLEQVVEEVDVFDAKRQKIIDFMEGCPAICFIKEAATGKYVYVNKAATELLGQEVLGRTDVDLFPLQEAKRYIGHDLDVIVSRSPIVLIETLQLNGKQLKFLMTKFLIENGEKCIGGIALPLPDTTKLKRSKVAQNESTKRA